MRSVEEGVEKAASCWAEQYNCAESVLRGVCHAQGIDLAEQGKRMATPFGGGVGRSEDMCGALVGGVLAIGIVKGRTNPQEDKLVAYDLAGRLHKKFNEQFASTSCRTLNMSDFKSPEHRKRCGRFVEAATRITAQILRD
jgi:C_GCAxxG_C_C family probable redox protein